MTLCDLQNDLRGASQCQKKWCGYSHPLDDSMEQVFEVPGIADIVVETWTKKTAATFYNHNNEQRATHFKCRLQEHDFVCFYEVIIRY